MSAESSDDGVNFPGGLKNLKNVSRETFPPIVSSASFSPALAMAEAHMNGFAGYSGMTIGN